jgi:hypothetical protein
MLGGTDNYAVDRVAVDRLEELLPGSKTMARNNRRFLERAVAILAKEYGIRQFIDIGSGLPTQNNVHQIVQSIDPTCRVVYVDIDPVVLTHQKVSALAENENAAFLQEDARDVDQILRHPDTERLIDFAEPATALYFSFLHFIPDEDDPWGMVRQMMDGLAPGSCLAISHVASDDPKVRRDATNLLLEVLGGHFGRVRTKHEVRRFFGSLEIVEPGLVDVNTWRPDGREEQQAIRWVEYGGVARKAS